VNNNQIKVIRIAEPVIDPLKNIVDVFKDGMADAALIASLFHYKIYSIQEVKDFLKNNGVEIR